MRRAKITFLPHLALLALIWLPFGVHMGPVLEEWGVLALYTTHGPFLFAGGDSLMPQHQMRPIMTALWALGYMVDPNSWWFWHLELAVLLLIKGVSMSAIAMYLTGSRRWAVVAGLLFIVWPADTLQMAFRASPITLAVAATSASAALMVSALSGATAGRRVALAVLASLCLLVGTWTYELTLAFWPLPFLIIWARKGFKGSFEVICRGWQALAVWGAMAALCIGYIVHTLLSSQVLYQKAVANQQQNVVATLIDHLPALFTTGALRALVTSWVDAACIAIDDFSSHWYFFFIAAVFGALLVLYRQRSQASWSMVAKVMVLGFGCVLVGYAPYTLAHLNSSDRTFMFAALGATLFFLALLVALEKASAAVAAVLAILLLTLGTAQQLWQFREYASLYERQRRIIRDIVEQAPALPADKVLIILDESQQLLDVYMLDELVPSVLAYVYGQKAVGQPVEVCFPQSGLWAKRDAALQQGSCEKTPEGWLFRAAAPVKAIADSVKPGPDLFVPHDKAVVVRVRLDGTESGKPIAMQEGSVVSQRYRGFLEPDAWPLRIFDTPPGDSYRWDFGRRWTMQQVNRGSGWGHTEWTYKPFRPVSGLWMNKPRAQLVFDLGEPRQVDYRLTAQLIEITENTRASLKTRINGIEVPVQWISPLSFSAVVPLNTVHGGSNLLEFETVPTDHPWGVSVHFDWITLSPTPG